MNFATKVLHGSTCIDPFTGASSVPIYQASTFHQFDLDQPGTYDYARSGNPTRHALEEAIAALEGGARGFAFSSGMAAISSVFMLFSAGDHIVVAEDVYGGTFRFLTRVLSRMGISVTFVDATQTEAVREAITPATKGVYLETPSNPTLKVTDIAAVSAVAKEHGLLVIVDNTFLTPYYQRPLELGADVVIHSATKFIGGHSDVVAGLAVTRDAALGEQLYLIQNGMGAILGVQDCWLVMRGLKTLKARLDVSTKSAGILAEWLSTHPGVSRVYYTGLADHPGHLVQQQQASGHGAVLSFDVGSRERAKALFDRVKLPIVAVSLGAVETILSYPVMMSHAAMPAAEREARGITDGLIRLSAGLEDVDDLLADLKQALDALPPLSSVQSQQSVQPQQKEAFSRA
ncbi:aminotransferase class I/II-fold pyridoxal phosphate-dependent enzyme [Brevibacillus agri]|uniref:trans-sulfuration enzyme family protein n=1 Tax=Brevibacillus TaxID=55080 RepID=UPI00027190D0|nr:MULTISPECIES: aminotransferase class I/II-fold pyridoxal phosphate-dependent enzyme [Brevibacillus]EJL42361.1 cystathionine beta-lyase/cystathionine gamma-synthase [Brevibacillus sp. CF112]MDN4092907.1 aminotransferase class I/II-fold pyridoxal phosphate-dependent enzyme [Brevibacillus agri]MDR9503356.1 aminotransferase class I/II-fold pyridoxal phosphate-dependent enzyme [Brevibacillus agri]MED1643560.1 aminotransferase class I/II-fold pyridoxal phosphate-dependent enzyme [Brevibacillus agr